MYLTDTSAQTAATALTVRTDLVHDRLLPTLITPNPASSQPGSERRRKCFGMLLYWGLRCSSGEAPMSQLICAWVGPASNVAAIREPLWPFGTIEGVSAQPHEFP